MGAQKSNFYQYQFCGGSPVLDLRREAYAFSRMGFPPITRIRRRKEIYR
jgi:hypothetical protein